MILRSILTLYLLGMSLSTISCQIYPRPISVVRWKDEACSYPTYMLKSNHQWFIYTYDSGERKLWRIPLTEYTPNSVANEMKNDKYKRQFIVMTDPMPNKYLKAFKKTCSVRVVEDASHLALHKGWNVIGDVELVRQPDRAFTRAGEYITIGIYNLPPKKYVYELTYTKED